jgi:hypothetical protein
MTQKFSNNARAALVGSLTAGATSFTIDSATADLFPIANTTDWLAPVNWFKAVIENSLGQVEIIRVGVRNAGSGLLSNVLRGQDGTAALAFSAGAVVSLRITAQDVEKCLAGEFPGPLTVGGKLTHNGVESRPVPVGGVIMFAGLVAAIPAGWQLCDGTNGTPDLRDKFIVAARQDDAGQTKTNITGALTKTGGSKDSIVVAHTHTGNTGGQSADHTHSGNTLAGGDHNHNVQLANAGGRFTAAGDTGVMASGFTNTSNAGSHTHAFSTLGASGNHTHSFTTDSTGASGANANLPPYYALAFICCMGYA